MRGMRVLSGKFDSVVAVSAVGQGDDLSGFSSTGPEIELAAPGERIPSTVPGGIASASGTSMASAHVSGAGGLVMASGRSNEEARSRLRETAEDVGLAETEGGKGLVDAETAATRAAFGETGTIEKLQEGADDWQSVGFDGTYDDPVVIAKPVSYVGGNPVHGRLRNVAADGFEWKLEEWLYLDEWHTTETLHYVVVEGGTHQLEDGTPVEAGTTTAKDDFVDTSFSQSFDAAPVVFSTSQTFNGGDPIVTRNRNVSTNSFSLRVQEEEARGWHTTETVGYVAIGSGVGSTYEVGPTGQTVTHEWYTIEFDGSYDSPRFVADMQTAAGWQPAGLRYRNLTGESVDVFVEEERSEEEETNHYTENVGYAVFDGAGPLS